MSLIPPATWRLVLDGRAPDIAEALRLDLGPYLARTVMVATTDEGLRVRIRTHAPPDDAAKRAADYLAQFWEPGGVLEGSGAGLLIEIGDRTWKFEGGPT